ncbi:IclR family transcriptional regulator domain-containing protein [Paraburkholderia xenovorans]|uniref:IclR family transcriptional regulator domain-containing protein n=1 Tax=Paraburkholderia xenovorans TaxID=36873 RepID=UPI0038B772C6
MIDGLPHAYTRAHEAAHQPHRGKSRRRLKAIRRATEGGYAISDEELEIGMSAMAVPVKNSAGQIVAALSVSVFSGRVNIETLRENFLPTLRETAGRLQRSL